jgi:hypothetical protein
VVAITTPPTKEHARLVLSLVVEAQRQLPAHEVA